MGTYTFELTKSIKIPHKESPQMPLQRAVVKLSRTRSQRAAIPPIKAASAMQTLRLSFLCQV